MLNFCVCIGRGIKKRDLNYPEPHLSASTNDDDDDDEVVVVVVVVSSSSYCCCSVVVVNFSFYGLGLWTCSNSE
jgi:hypothetical protein